MRFSDGNDGYNMTLTPHQALETPKKRQEKYEGSPLK
jgi:hypothetical protein